MASLNVIIRSARHIALHITSLKSLLTQSSSWAWRNFREKDVWMLMEYFWRVWRKEDGLRRFSNRCLYSMSWRRDEMWSHLAGMQGKEWDLLSSRQRVYCSGWDSSLVSEPLVESIFETFGMLLGKRNHVIVCWWASRALSFFVLGCGLGGCAFFHTILSFCFCQMRIWNQ